MSHKTYRELPDFYCGAEINTLLTSDYGQEIRTDCADWIEIGLGLIPDIDQIETAMFDLMPVNRRESQRVQHSLWGCSALGLIIAAKFADMEVDNRWFTLCAKHRSPIIAYLYGGNEVDDAKWEEKAEQYEIIEAVINAVYMLNFVTNFRDVMNWLRSGDPLPIAVTTK